MLFNSDPWPPAEQKLKMPCDIHNEMWYFLIYITLCQIHSLVKCQIFQLYNFYALYVLNTSLKLIYETTYGV